MNHTQQETTAPLTSRGPRLTGIDAARGLALIGLISVHILPVSDPLTSEVTLQGRLFAGQSAALFALLAGVGLAFTSGGRTPRHGQEATADKVGLLVRAALIFAVGLAINQVMPEPTPAVGILVYYGVFFLLAVPFLHLPAKALFACSALFTIVGPVLVHGLREVLPVFESESPTFIDLVTAPGTTLSQLLLTGTYPALPYLAYLLAGLGLGRLRLGELRVQITLVWTGIALAMSTWLIYQVVILRAGGFNHLMDQVPALSEDQVDEILVFGPDPALPTTSWWWLLTPGPHTNTPVAVLQDLGVGVAVLGFFLLLARVLGAWLMPLVAMGSMTLTLYSAHLLALATQVHDDRPHQWFLIHLGVAVVFAVLWRRFFGQGPLERLVARTASAARRRILSTDTRTS